MFKFVLHVIILVAAIQGAQYFTQDDIKDGFTNIEEILR